MIELSILIPAVFERQSFDMYNYLLRQIGDNPVEVLTLFDNKKRTLGAKRNALMALAQGRYITHCDDDDSFIEPFIGQVLSHIKTNPEADVIAYDQMSSLNGGETFRVSTDIANHNEEARQVGGRWLPIRRKPWLWCCWRRELVQHIPFPDCTNAEDYKWLQRVWPLVKFQTKIDHVLHVYCYSDQQSVAKGLP